MTGDGQKVRGPPTSPSGGVARTGGVTRTGTFDCSKTTGTGTPNCEQRFEIKKL